MVILFFVIGNTEYKKVKIDNAKHLIESMYSAGFKTGNNTTKNIKKDIDAIQNQEETYFQQE